MINDKTLDNPELWFVADLRRVLLILSANSSHVSSALDRSVTDWLRYVQQQEPQQTRLLCCTKPTYYDNNNLLFMASFVEHHQLSHVISGKLVSLNPKCDTSNNSEFYNNRDSVTTGTLYVCISIPLISNTIQQINAQFLPFLTPSWQCQSIEGKYNPPKVCLELNLCRLLEC